MTRVGVGVDVSKDWLDIATTAAVEAWRVRNSPEGLSQLVGELGGLDVHRVVLEASGGYEGAALATLHAAGLAVVLIQPMRARHFARAVGQRAKTDELDAQVLARMALLAVDEVPLWAPAAEHQADLKALIERRQQLLALRDGEKKRLRFARAIVRADLERSVSVVTAQVVELEQRIDALIASDARLSGDVALL